MQSININSLSDQDYQKLREEIMRKLKKRLTLKRFEHTLRVEETALLLAQRFSGDKQKVSLAALLHDYAKNYSDEKKLALSKKLHLTLAQEEVENLDLIHSKLGALIAMKKFHITDPEIIHAIMYHTTGRPHMTLTEKIIYIADFIEPGRKQFPELFLVRQLAESNINEAVIKKLLLTMQYLIDKGQYIDPITRETYEYYFDLHRTK